MVSVEPHEINHFPSLAKDLIAHTAQQDELEVNSLHHQAIGRNGMIEATELSDKRFFHTA